MKQKFVSFSGEAPKDTWNQIMFRNCEVLSCEMQEFKAGKRFTLEILVPGLKKKYYLYAWNENNLADIISESGVRAGDTVSVYAVLGYYKNREGRYCEAYRICPNIAFEDGMSETENFFSLMRIVRNDAPAVSSTGKLSTDDLVRKLLGN